MRKYWTVFGLSFQNEFVYRLNFILWRLRNVLRIAMTYFLWSSVFTSNTIAFGYNKNQIVSYVFLVLLVNSFVMSAPSNDNIGGEIGNGDLSNYLVKPFSYLKYWLTRDWASKLLNMLFAAGEFFVLYLLLRPQINLASSPVMIVVGLTMVLLGSLIYFFVTKLAVLVSFWTPENTWGLMFLFLVLYEILSGGIFPLDVLPPVLYRVLQWTPFPYMVYFPLAVLVGKIGLEHALRILLQSVSWLLISFLLVAFQWKKGLKVYSASGR